MGNCHDRSNNIFKDKRLYGYLRFFVRWRHNNKYKIQKKTLLGFDGYFIQEQYFWHGGFLRIVERRYGELHDKYINYKLNGRDIKSIEYWDMGNLISRNEIQ